MWTASSVPAGMVLVVISSLFNSVALSLVWVWLQLGLHARAHKLSHREKEGSNESRVYGGRTGQEDTCSDGAAAGREICGGGTLRLHPVALPSPHGCSTSSNLSEE